MSKIMGGINNRSRRVQTKMNGGGVEAAPYACRRSIRDL